MTQMQKNKRGALRNSFIVCAFYIINVTWSIECPGDLGQTDSLYQIVYFGNVKFFGLIRRSAFASIPGSPFGFALEI